MPKAKTLELSPEQAIVAQIPIIANKIQKIHTDLERTVKSLTNLNLNEILSDDTLKVSRDFEEFANDILTSINVKKVEAEQEIKKIDEKLIEVRKNYDLKVAEIQRDLEIKLSDKKRKFDNDIQDYGYDAIENYAKEHNLELLTKTEYDNLTSYQSKYTELSEKYTKELTSEVNKRVSAAERDLDKHLEIKEYEYKASQAQNEAKLEQYKGTIDSLNETIQSYIEQLNTAQQNVVKVAEAKNSAVSQNFGNLK